MNRLTTFLIPVFFLLNGVGAVEFKQETKVVVVDVNSLLTKEQRAELRDTILKAYDIEAKYEESHTEQTFTRIPRELTVRVERSVKEIAEATNLDENKILAASNIGTRTIYLAATRKLFLKVDLIHEIGHFVYACNSRKTEEQKTQNESNVKRFEDFWVLYEEGDSGDK